MNILIKIFLQKYLNLILVLFLIILLFIILIIIMASVGRIVKANRLKRLNSQHISSNTNSNSSSSRSKSSSSNSFNSIKISWPNNSVLTREQKIQYHQEILLGKSASLLEIVYDPSSPDSDEICAKYFQIKNLNPEEVIDKETYDNLAKDEDLPGLYILALALPENRQKLLIGIIKCFNKWRVISLAKTKYFIYQGWFNLDYGWLGVEPSARYTHETLKICSDSRVLLQAYVDKLTSYNVSDHNRYFEFINVCIYNYETYKIEYQQKYSDTPPDKEDIFFSLETGLTCNSGALKFANIHWQIGSNIDTLYEQHILWLRINYPLGVETKKITKDLISIFCSPRCSKNKFYDLDNKKIVKWPNLNIYLHKGYRFFSTNEDYCRRVIKFYRRQKMPGDFFGPKVHPILRQYYTVLFVYNK